MAEIFFIFSIVYLTGSSSEWHKEEPYDKGIYKPYHMSIDKFGCLNCNSYYILEVVHNTETYGIYIPCYELPVFEELPGLRAE